MMFRIRFRSSRGRGLDRVPVPYNLRTIRFELPRTGQACRLSSLHRRQELPELRILEHAGPSMDQHDGPVRIQQDDGWRGRDLEGLRHVVVDVESGREDERVRMCPDI